MQFQEDTLRWLAGVADLAAVHQLSESADKISDAIIKAAPNSVTPHIVAALGRMQTGRHDEAVKILKEDALAVDPDSVDAKSYLVLAYGRAGKEDESKTLAHELSNTVDDPVLRSMVDQAIAS